MIIRASGLRCAKALDTTTFTRVYSKKERHVGVLRVGLDLSFPYSPLVSALSFFFLSRLLLLHILLDASLNHHVIAEEIAK